MEEGSNPEASTQLLKQKYDLHKAPEVTAAARRTEVRTGEYIPQDPLDRIQNYLNRFREIDDREDPQQRERGIEAIKRLFHEKHIIKPDEIPESYWENQHRIIRERGQEADLEHVDWDKLKRQNTEVIIADQSSSMDKWIDYLSSPDAPYPDWFKYCTARSVLELNKGAKTEEGHIVFNKRVYAQRDKDGKLLNEPTVGPFPELDREALAYVADALQKKYGDNYFTLHDEINDLNSQIQLSQKNDRERKLLQLAEEKLQQTGNEKLIEVEFGGKTRALKKKDIDALQKKLEEAPVLQTDMLEERLKTTKQHFQKHLDLHNLPEEFRKFPNEEEFAKLYAYAIEKVTPASKEQLSNTQGLWVKYNQGSDHMPLVTSLQGHGTGWCTAGESTANAQLQGGDFYVYYSHDRDGKPTVPRVAIRMEGSGIAEVRGIAPEQNLDPYVAPIVEQKLEEFPDGKAYQKKVVDMKHLTEIERKAQSGTPLSATDLTFLYEVDSPIQGFGYSRDPRIEELRNQRNPEEDMPVVFGCDASQIAHNLRELRSDTKAYIGPLVPGIFDRLQERKLEHVYTSFPEGKIRSQSIEIGGKTKEQLRSEMEQAGVNVSYYAEDMMKSPDFTTLPTAQMLDTVRLKVGDLGLSGYPTTDQVYRKAQELGLELCPAEVGPQMRLQTKDQPMGDYYWIGMKQITDSNDYPRGFDLGRSEDGLWLDGGWTKPGHGWYPDYEFVFSLRKSETQNPQTLSSLLKNLLKR